MLLGADPSLPYLGGVPAKRGGQAPRAAALWHTGVLSVSARSRPLRQADPGTSKFTEPSSDPRSRRRHCP